MTEKEYAVQKVRVDRASTLIADIQLVENILTNLREDKDKLNESASEGGYRYSVIRKRLGYCNELELWVVDEEQLIVFLINHLENRKKNLQETLEEI